MDICGYVTSIQENSLLQQRDKKKKFLTTGIRLVYRRFTHLHPARFFFPTSSNIIVAETLISLELSAPITHKANCSHPAYYKFPSCKRTVQFHGASPGGRSIWACKHAFQREDAMAGCPFPTEKKIPAIISSSFCFKRVSGRVITLWSASVYIYTHTDVHQLKEGWLRCKSQSVYRKERKEEIVLTHLTFGKLISL